MSVDPVTLAIIQTKTVPVGAVTAYAAATAPAGWLACDGSAVSRTTYAALYALIGNTYGAGDGSSTFNLPDLQERIPIGSGQRTVGTNDGVAAASRQANHGHAHGHTATTNTTGSHGHTTGTASGNQFPAATSGGNQVSSMGHTHSVNSNGDHAHTVTVSASTDYQHPYMVLRYIIKAS